MASAGSHASSPMPAICSTVRRRIKYASARRNGVLVSNAARKLIFSTTLDCLCTEQRCPYQKIAAGQTS